VKYIIILANLANGYTKKALTIALNKINFMNFPYEHFINQSEIIKNTPILKGNSLNKYEFGLL
jgi:hypothetical protein